MFNSATMRTPSGSTIPGQLRPSVIDCGELIGRCMGEASIALQLLQMFGANLSSVEEQIESHIGEGEFPQAARLVHKLKGESGNMSAIALHQASSRLEAILKSDHRSQVLPALAVLQDEVQNFLTALPLAVESLTDGG